MRASDVLPAAVGVALCAVGVAVLARPRFAGGMFGIPLDGGPATAYLRAAGARDLLAGMTVLASLGERRALRRVVALGGLIGFADGLIVMADRGLSPALAAHFGGFAVVAMVALTIDE